MLSPATHSHPKEGPNELLIAHLSLSWSLFGCGGRSEIQGPQTAGDRGGQPADCRGAQEEARGVRGPSTKSRKGANPPCALRSSGDLVDRFTNGTNWA